MKGPRMIVIKGEYEFDHAHTAVFFEARHAMVTKIRGEFRDWSATLSAGDHLNDLRVRAEIRAASLHTGVPPRDVHLRSADFLDVREHPYITFESTATHFHDDRNGVVEGTLTMRGVSRPETFTVELGGADIDLEHKYRVGFSASMRINRRDYGVEFQKILESGSVLVSEEVTIAVEGSILYLDPPSVAG
ncbi:MAG: YceI family protein [Corynebacterium sp.]|uniref:YceI family protein n=1 Tax=Corynebacterium sp. TaxID=1720 RepID=UPI0026E05760|nr:YceI family protein [Corynebacterium sp.]MDO5669192.1 YceI family protein [Corynebacterium sp.]